MKKFVSLLLLVLMLTSTFVYAEASTIDLSAMTKEELIALIDDARLELSKYLPYAEKGTVLYEDEHIKITLNGELELEYGCLLMPVIIENYSDRELLVSFDRSSCNGWDILESATNVSANKKAKTDIMFLDAEEAAELSSVDDVTDITATIHLFDNDDIMWSFESEPITWLFGE